MSTVRDDPAFSDHMKLGTKPRGLTKPHGLTKREYFAACALQGILAEDVRGDVGYTILAEDAVRHADALIAALNESKP